MRNPKILVVVGDESEQTEPLVELLRERSHGVETVRGAGPAADLLTEAVFDVVVCDHPVGETDLLSLVPPETRVVVAAAAPSVKDSVDALKRGALDYLPLEGGARDLAAAVEKAAYPEKEEKASEPSERGVGNLVGKSPGMEKVYGIIAKVARTGSTVLITGESGTGKELIARAIHENSDRVDGPLVVINCGAIPGELLESELFGHEKGAFTGAHKARMGRFEMADGGTVFLDEIGDMSPDLQVKLLRAIQEQVFERVGSTRSIKVDLRIISATNKDLPLSIEKGEFREDLFYRLNVIPVIVPPLRERKSDIPLLVEHFLGKLAVRMNLDRKTVSEEALALLSEYDWPGNIRELENMMERLSVLVDDEIITPADLPDHIAGDASGKDDHADLLFPVLGDMGFNDAVEQHQRALILDALNRTNWVKAKAAELLKMNRTTLVEKIKKMNLESVREEMRAG